MGTNFPQQSKSLKKPLERNVTYMKLATEDPRTIYMIAVCGTGMSALAGLLKSAGHHVTGSDTNIYPPVSTLLQNYGIEVKPGYKAENVPQSADLVIIGNAVSRNNPEVKAAMEKNLPFTSFPEALGQFFLDDYQSLVVVGTHGKTTTTSLLAWIFQGCGKEPGFLIGGWLKNFDSNYHPPRGDYFLTEGDEYDTAFFDKEPKFLHYRPKSAILTGIEFDHADIYQNLEQIKAGFKKFTRLIPSEGYLLVGDSGKNTDEIVATAQCKVEIYGFSSRADWQISEYFSKDGRGNFLLSHKGKKVCRFDLPMIGMHNAENATGAIALAIKLGLDSNSIAKALSDFKGVKKRQEIVGTKKGVTVIDDFAHHPTAINLTLQAIRKTYPGRRVWAVFEPRSATSRRNTFQEQFSSCFQHADLIVLAQLFAPEKIQPDERLNLNRLILELKNAEKEAWLIPQVDDIINFIVDKKRSGDVVVIMSSGGFSGIHQKLLDRL